MANNKQTEDITVTLKKIIDTLESKARVSISQEPLPIEQLKFVVRTERKKQKVTRDMLAKLAGVSVGTVNAVETGKLTVSVMNLQKILNALGKKLCIR